MTSRPNWRRKARQILPTGTPRGDAADLLHRTIRETRMGARRVGDVIRDDQRIGPISPRSWLRRHHATNESERSRELLTGSLRDGYGPELAVVLDCRRGGDAAPTMASLDGQWSRQWRTQHASTDHELRTVLTELAEDDPRRPVVLARPGDEFRPDFVIRLLDAFWEAPGLRVVHWDETRTDRGEGLRVRPSWSPDLLTAANPLGRAFAMRAAQWAAFDPGLGDDAWWDALLAAGLDATEVRRLARVSMLSPHPHPNVSSRAAEVVARELDRRGWPARPVADLHAVRLDWQLESWPKVTVVVPSRYNRPLLERLLPSLAATDYPDFEVVVVDNAGQADDKDAWYAGWGQHFPIQVLWWDRPFNYSAVNNAASLLGSGDVLTFLNDDTEATDALWLRQMVGWATRDTVGTVGAQLIDPAGLIQHGGVVLGMDGSAGHLFAGGAPAQDSMLGRTEWTRNVLASTAACVTMRREVFEACGGFDERFVLCGSDVALGLEAHNRGWRNVVVPAVGMRHMESATRGADSGVPEDLDASWWRYQRWVIGGDPYFSPSLSLTRHWPSLRPPGERPAGDVMLESIGRSAGVFRQQMLEETAEGLARAYPVGDAVVAGVHAGHDAVTGHQEVRTVNWILPGFDNPFYGGLATIIRIAEHLDRTRDVEQRFVILDSAQDAFYRSALAAGSARLAGAELVFLDGDGVANVDRIPPADAAVSTMWTTAYVAAAAPAQRRRFYLIQDFEPSFYPAGTMYALAEETYRLGLYGICNTEPIHTMYTQRYGGTAGWFLPAVDRDVFHPPPVPRATAGDGPVRVFVYARPGHWRNCWELAKPALESIKQEFGDGVHLVTAGSWASPDDLGRGIEHLGLLDVRSTGELYRTCDVGVALTVSEHPSYLPGELMACGVPVVAFDLPEAGWILTHEVTGLRARRTVEGLREQLSRIVGDSALRHRLAEGAVAHIAAHHSDWDAALEGIYDMLCNPATS